MNRSNLHPKIVKCIDEMMSDMVLLLYYYGEFCQFINFEESKHVERIGVTVNTHGMVCYWNREFVNSTPQKHINFIVIHEIFHLLFDHPKRTRRGGYNHEMSNIAQDMCINQAIYSDLIDTTKPSKDFLELPTEKVSYLDKTIDDVWVLMMPKEYKGQHVFEDLYEWLKQEKRKYNEWKKGGSCQGQGSGKEGKSGDCPVSDYLKKVFDGMDDGIKNWLDNHLPCDLSDDFKKEVVGRVQRYLRSRGLEKANIKITLEKLQKSRKDYLRDIKTAISSIRGYNKEKSISKRNRRSIEGIKGRFKIGFGLNVILDVSGSMGGYFQRVLSYIFQNKIKINLIQCDVEVKRQGKRDYTVINNKREFKKIQLVGGGGTTLQPAIDFIVGCSQINQLNTVILTDGFTDNLDVSKLKKTLILSIGKECGIIAGSPKQIVIQDDLPAEEDI
jgi:predicted metal-dependent peptidase